MGRPQRNSAKSHAVLSDRRRRRPYSTPEERDEYMMDIAYDLVEQRILEGTATSQETTHFLKLRKLNKEIEILDKQKELMTAKAEALKSAKRVEELYTDAIKAFREYNGQENEPEDSDDQDIY